MTQPLKHPQSESGERERERDDGNNGERQAMGQMLNVETYLDHIAYEVDNVEPAISADNGDSLAQQIAEIQV